MKPDRCSHCQTRKKVAYGPFGLCSGCSRKASVVFSRRHQDVDGVAVYQCSLCSLAGESTRVKLNGENNHMKATHGCEQGHHADIIREYERLAALARRSDEQRGLEAFCEADR